MEQVKKIAREIALAVITELSESVLLSLLICAALIAAIAIHGGAR